MYTTDVIAHFSPSNNDHRGAKAAITEALGLSSGYVSQWGEIVPEVQAMKLERITGGALKYDPEIYKKASA